MSSKKNDYKSRTNGTRESLSDSSSTNKQQRQTEAMQKLGSIFKKKTEQKRQPDSWQSLIQNLLHSQRGKLPLLLAVEAGNQSMVRELLSSQTAEQLKVSNLKLAIFAAPVDLTSRERVCWHVEEAQEESASKQEEEEEKFVSATARRISE
jgi:hypothetical protein